MINSSTGDQDHPDQWISGGGSHLMGSHDNWGQVSDNDDEMMMMTTTCDIKTQKVSIWF